MTMHPSMSYRITTLELEQAAVRAERARMAAEHADQIVHRDGILRRALLRLRAGRIAPAAAPVVPAAPAAAPGEAAPVVPAVTASAAEPAVRVAVIAGPRAERASAAGAPGADSDDRELVDCAPHAA